MQIPDLVDSLSVVREIVQRNTEIRSVAFVGFTQPDSVQDRVQLSHAESNIVDQAIQLRKSTQLPFWDAVFVSLFDSEEDVSVILEAASLHQSWLAKEEWIERELLLSTEMWRHLPNSPCAILSEVRLDSGGTAHIPMLDFHAPSPRGISIVRSVAAKLFKGTTVLLDSGKSYHAYCTSLLSKEAFNELLIKALLYAPVVDRAYVAHQLLEGRAMLRITPGFTKLKTPTVVARIECEC